MFNRFLSYTVLVFAGHFAVVAFNFSHSPLSKAELWGLLSPQMNGYCTTFSFFAHGSDPGLLTVTFVDYLDNSRVVVWAFTPTSENRDTKINAQFPHVNSRKFYVSIYSALLHNVLF